jgi:Ca-activated chloride channel family protein
MHRPAAVLALALLLAAPLAAHEWVDRPLAPHLIVPQRHVFLPVPRPQPVAVTGVTAAVALRDGVAVTTIDVGLSNPGRTPQEAELLMPVPDGCVVTGLDFQGSGSEPTARLLPREEAVAIYRRIVAQMRDPALMEFVGLNLIRSSVFPVPPGGTQRLRLTYEQILPVQGARVDYWLPRSDLAQGTVPWTISLTVEDRAGVASVYSPTHAIDIARPPSGPQTVTLAKAERMRPGAFRLSYLRGREEAVSVLAYPDAKAGGGYFLLMAGAPAVGVHTAVMPREVTLVIDHSGSMNGGKIDQVRASAQQVIAGLADGERFNIVLYNHGVERFAEAPLAKDRDSEARARSWLDAMRPCGGTNIHDALFEALRQPPTPGLLPVVIFLTDGIATVGPTSEREIRDLAATRNPHRRRVFTLGVGADVNSHLLEKIADATRASVSFALPGEDIEVTVGELAERLHGPVLSDLQLAVRDAAGADLPGRVQDVSPLALGDLFAGQRLVVLGRYVGEAPLTFCLAGTVAGGGGKELSVAFDPASATTANSWVARLWASRRIGTLIDAIREMGMDGSTAHATDPRYRELVGEVVRLSTTFGILTEYTAFLAEEGGVPAGAPAMAAAADAVLRERAWGERDGAGSVAQSLNNADRKGAEVLNPENRMRDRALAESGPATTVRQTSDNAYYQRGNRWIDSRLMARAADGALPAVQRRVAFASDEYWTLAERLATEQRQSALATPGELLLEIDGEVLAIENGG